MMVGEFEYEALFPHDAADNPPPFEYYSNLMFVVFVGATSVHVTKHLYGVRLRDLVYMTSIYMK